MQPLMPFCYNAMPRFISEISVLLELMLHQRIVALQIPSLNIQPLAWRHSQTEQGGTLEADGLCPHFLSLMTAFCNESTENSLTQFTWVIPSQREQQFVLLAIGSYPGLDSSDLDTVCLPWVDIQNVICISCVSQSIASNSGNHITTYKNYRCRDTSCDPPSLVIE